jgi:hypothetical protein
MQSYLLAGTAVAGGSVAGGFSVGFGVAVGVGLHAAKSTLAMSKIATSILQTCLDISISSFS